MQNTQNNETNNARITLYGWECHKCGAVMAPHMNVCINCKGNDTYTVASSLTNSTNVKMASQFEATKYTQNLY